MIRLSAPLSSLTAFIAQDAERIHFSTGEVSCPADGSSHPCALKSLSILPPMPSEFIHRRIAYLSAASASDIGSNLAPIDTNKPFFSLVQRPTDDTPAADLYLPSREYSRVQAAIHRFGHTGHISFPVDLANAIPAAAPLPGNGLPNPLAILFLLERRILCQSILNLEIAVSQDATNLIPPLSHASYYEANTLHPCG